MLIACEKCATTYVLDERLIPAAGAPVQCTRCGHVFTAKPGASAPAAADAPKERSTMMFGKTSEKPAHQTMMFGAGGEAPTPPPSSAAAPAPTNRTMMFGAAGADASAKVAPKNATMMFGAGSAGPVPAANAPTNRTMMFGAVAGPAAPAAPAPVTTRPNSQTMVFGTAAVPPAAAPASAPNRTMMFGIPTTDKPNAEPAAAPKSNTMMFGAAEAAGNPGKLTERTVRIGPDDLERMMREHNAKGERGAEMTPPEGAPAGASQKTQMFAMSDIRPPDASTPQEGVEAVAKSGESGDQVQVRHDRTAMFAMSPEAPALPPLVTAEQEAFVPAEKSNVRFDPSLMETLPPGGPDGESPVRATMIFGAGQGAPARPALVVPIELTTNPDLIATTMPNLPSLPKERLAPRQALDAAPAEEPAASPEDMGLALAQQVKRRNKVAMAIVVLAVIAAAGAVGWKVFGGKLFGKAVPLEAMQKVESGLAELRKDDTASKAAAVLALTAVVKSQPGFVDAHAGLVTALTLQLDDLQQRAKRLEKAAEERNARTARYNKEKTPSDYENRAAALVAEVQAIKKDYDPLVASARELEARLRDAYRAMQVAASQGGELNRQAELALIRAQALYHAYGGTDEALKLTKRYQSKSEGTSDVWIELVDAEYAANTRASPDLVEAAQKQLTALHERDPTFFRTYVLAARLHLQAKQYDEAEEQLQTVAALKPTHDVANELGEWVKKVKAEATRKEKDKAP